MTIALPARAERRSFGIDVSRPVLYIFAGVLCVLIVLPLSWLLMYSVTDGKGGLTLANFYRLFAEINDDEPLVTTFIGIWLLGGLFMSLGCFASALTRSLSHWIGRLSGASRSLATIGASPPKGEPPP